MRTIPKKWKPVLIAAIAIGGAALVAMCVHVSGPTTPAPTSSELTARVAGVNDSAIRLEWERVVGLRGTRILLGAEPAEIEGGAIPGAVEIAELSSDESEHRLEGIAPGVDAFLRVEAQTADGPHSVDLQVRTRGGPDAELTSPVRSVAFVAPDVMKIVLANGDGDDWADDDWTVRTGDGAAVDVRAVHRHSYPVGQPAYEIGPAADNDIDEIEIDHAIFLRLASPVRSPQVLRVEGPSGVAFWLPFSDRRLETPVVQLNQVGYNPRATKRWAYISAWLGDGGALSLDGFPSEVEIVREHESGRRVAVGTAPVTERAEHDDDAGTEVREIDLSNVTAAEGVTYRIRVPGVGVSYPTQVSEIATFKAFYTVARGMYHNRWAGDLTEEHTEWPRPPDHLRVYTSDNDNPFEMHPESTPRTGERTVRGGHHDAGDFDIRPSHTVVAQTLMRAYELDPDRFTDGQLTIPESGNGIPDLLDEALWSIAGWIALQEEDGGVRAGIESHRHPNGYYFAHEDPLPYWTYARDPRVTVRVAGLFAQASRLVRPFDAERAADLERRAKKAYDWATGRGELGTFQLYGAGELFRLTGDPRYGADFERTWASMGRDGVFSNYSLSHLSLRDYREADRAVPDFIVGYLMSEGANPELRETARRWMDQHANSVAQEILESRHAHRNARAHYPPDWGTGTTPGRNLDAIFARLQLGDHLGELPDDRRQRYFDAISVAADYVLGANPAGMVWITGLGTRYPREPLHTDSLVWLKRGRSAVPGIPVYGPVHSLPGAHYYRPGEAAFHPAFAEHPLMRRYGDLRTFVNTNEFTVWETQAPHTEHFGALMADGMTPPRSWLPGQRDHANPLPTTGR